jgi:two-component system, chemotaxis family, sensor kinase CheA
MEEFIQEFKAESGAIIETLQGLLMSYDESTSKAQIAEELFRGIHTLKGTSKMFGFEKIEEITHQLENILDDCRSKEKSIPTSLIDLCIHILDYCDQVLNGKGEKETHDRLLQAVNNYLNTSGKTAEAQTAVYCILFTPAADIFERGVNPLAIFDELNQLGDFVSIVHNEKKSLEKQVQDKKLESVFELWLSTEKPLSDVEDVFLFMKSHEYEIIIVETNEDSCQKLLTRIEAKPGFKTGEKELKIRAAFISKYIANTEAPAQTEHILVADKEITPLALTPSTIQSNGDVKLNYLNVALPKLDQMMNLVSEFVTLSAEVKHYANALGHDQLKDTVERLERVSTLFRDNAFSMRLVPIQILSVKLQRYVREISAQVGKKVKFITEGMDTEIDKAIINQIEAPLMHIIRNAMDHGLETPAERIAKGKPEEGILKISAFYSGTNVFIHIQDDGAGIDFEKVRAKAIATGLIAGNEVLTENQITELIFKPGFSTAEKVSELSGRGVGMDVVKREISNLRGSIDITTEKDLGTSFAIRLPLALSIMDVMLVKVGNMNYMFPHHEIEICSSEKFEDVIERKGYNLRYNDQLLPYMDMNVLLGEKISMTLTDRSVVILNKNDNMLAVEVDEIVGKEQVVIKPVDEALQMISYLSGTTILGNGDLAFLIDVVKLKELYAKTA